MRANNFVTLPHTETYDVLVTALYKIYRST
jgi:hypothetical protein